MRLLQKLFRKPAAAQGIVALSFAINGIAVAIMRYGEHNRPRLLYCDFISAAQPQWPTELAALCKAHQLDSYDCHVLLAGEQYQNFSIEAPQVNADEIKQAIGWRIAELLDYPIEQATIDHYPLPTSNRANSLAMLEAISCDSTQLKPLLQGCDEAGLPLKVVDIQETALRNLAILLPENEQGVAVLHLQQHSGRLIIEKQGALYLSRKLDFGYSQMHDSNLLEQNNLALEIQRSFDYVENYFDIPPISSLAMIVTPNQTQDIINFLMINHGITARIMDISAIVDCDMILNDALQNSCAPVIGASLRRWVDTLA